ncbi:MAG: response regulator [Bacteroidota bacterium]
MPLFKSILLIDDDDATNYLHKLYINEWGLTEKIYVANNGQEAIDFLQTHPNFHQEQPSLILLDINMPVMNGFEFLEAYSHLEKTKKASTVVVMLTTSLHPKDLQKANLFPDLKAYINKPLTKAEIVKIATQTIVSE